MIRLTKKDKRHRGGYQIPCGYPNYYENIFIKLGQLEDLLEKYNVNEMWELEMILDYYEHRYDNVQTRRVKDE